MYIQAENKKQLASTKIGSVETWGNHRLPFVNVRLFFWIIKIKRKQDSRNRKDEHTYFGLSNHEMRKNEIYIFHC